MGEGDVEEHDVIVVGGGTAGAVVASRLTEDPGCRVAAVEGGPSDVGNPRVLQLRRWQELLESELDYDYPTVEQPRGNSYVRHARARVLGGCSSHNTLISFQPLPSDWDDWAARGCTGWDAATMAPYYRRLRNTIAPVAEQDRNPVARDFVASVTAALGVPEVDDFNATPFTDGAGFFSVAYDPATGTRSSSSVAYLHPHLDRPNLTLLLETRARRLEIGRDGRATGVHLRRPDGSDALVRARHEVVVCAGAIDTPRLLMLSGVGPADELRALGLDVVADLPGVGGNLRDHPESVILWETPQLPPNTAMYSDAGLFVRRDRAAPGPDLMAHFYQVPFTTHTERLGYPVPEHGVCLTPNIPKARSVGRMWLRSADPEDKPALDFRYFTDPEGHDEQTIVDGLEIAREVAAASPLSGWLLREVAPGPDVRDRQALSEYGRRVAHTVYHPAGTCAMGPDGDARAVVDPELRVRGVPGLRVVDASVFPELPSANPMVAILMVGERAAELVAASLRG
jgi:choline dehydrogenase-like flavoprotein